MTKKTYSLRYRQELFKRLMSIDIDKSKSKDVLVDELIHSATNPDGLELLKTLVQITNEEET